MSSPKQRRDRPIESVALKIALKVNAEATERIWEAVPSARSKRGVVEIAIQGATPAEVAEGAKKLLEALRAGARPRRL
jgi:hypothetical protein